MNPNKQVTQCVLINQDLELFTGTRGILGWFAVSQGCSIKWYGQSDEGVNFS